MTDGAGSGGTASVAPGPETPARDASEPEAIEPPAIEPVPPAPPRGTPGIPRAGESARGTPGIPTRPRGLSAPYIPGGDDPEIAETRRRERPYIRLLIGMVAVIVGGTLILTILAIASSILYR
jgi:hypothetical protein